MKSKRSRTNGSRVGGATSPLSRTLRTLPGAIAALTVSSEARAAGTALDVQSARCTGMAAACTAAIDDSAAIFYNPAGIARGKTLDAQVGVSLIDPAFRFQDSAGNVTQMPFRVVPPLTAYVAGGLTRHLSIGIGAFTPYGLAIQWPAAWEGRSELTKANFQSYDFNPTIAYRLGPVRVGAGFQLVRATIELQKDISFGTQYGSADLGAGAWAVGGNGGVQVDAVRQYLTIGATYRSAVHFNFDGHGHFDDVPAAFAPIFHDQAVSTGLTNPDQFAVGASTRPIKSLLFDFDVVWTGWSKLRSIDIDFPNDTSHSLSSSEPKNWHDTVNYHLGGEGVIARDWRVRGGLLFDPTPSPEQTLAADLPDASRLNIAVGGGYVHPIGVRVDLAYQILVLLNHTSTFPTLPGQYGGVVNIVGISVGYTLPNRETPPSDSTIQPGAPPPPPTAPPPPPPAQPPVPSPLQPSGTPPPMVPPSPPPLPPPVVPPRANP